MKKIALLLAAFLVLISGCSADEPAGPSPSPQPEQGIVQKQTGAEAPSSVPLYGRSFLAVEEQIVYDRLFAACEAYDTGVRIPLSGEWSAERFAVLAKYFVDDCPQFYWAQPRWSETAKGRFAVLSVEREMAAAELRRRDNEIAAAVQAMQDGTPGGDAAYVYEIHDRMVERINYDGGNLREDSENIYGALVNRYAVCDGYARTFQFLMQKQGLACVWLGGTSDKDVPHAWNAVQLEEDWYYVDVTWDATDPWRRKTFHTYLCLTEEEMLRSHVFDPVQYPVLPQAQSRTYNYYEYHRAAVEPTRGAEVRQLAEAFVNRLELESVSEEPARVFLDVKIYASNKEYQRVRELFVAELYAILKEMDALAQQRGLAVEIATSGEIRCNFNDEQQILMLLPNIGEKRT